MEAVILASGRGTRLRELTKYKPKSMIEVNKKPIIEYTIDNLRENDIEDIILVVGYKKEKIVDYFSDGKKLGVKISYVEQEKPDAGTANAVSYARKLIKGDRLLMVYGDVMFEKDLIKELIEKGDFVISLKKVENPRDYGVAEIEDDRVVRIVEKSQNPSSNLANAGVYVLPKEIFTAINQTKLSERGEYEITDSIQKLIDSGFECNFVLIKGFWADIGNMENLRTVKKYFE
jgi:bifunctional UDP-N-acetylglucosamine pyrophosphorylase/glucosamine-1-phosphate N-acetyltransferase